MKISNQKFMENYKNQFFKFLFPKRIKSFCYLSQIGCIRNAKFADITFSITASNACIKKVNYYTEQDITKENNKNLTEHAIVETYAIKNCTLHESKDHALTD